MIKTSINNIMNSIPIFRTISETPMNIISAYKLVKIIKAIEKEQQYFLEAQQRLVKQYLKKDSQDAVIDEKFIDQYNSEIKIFLDTQIELAVEPIDIEDIKNVEITPAQLYLIDDFLQKK